MRPFAKGAPRWARLPLHWGRRLVGWAPGFLPFLLVVLLAFALVPLFWMALSTLLPNPHAPTHLPARVTPGHSAVATLDRYNPFGAPPPVSVHGTPQDGVVASSLALKLMGVAVLPDPHRSLAILGAGNIERVYRVGDLLPGGARIVAVYPDRVVLRYQGVLQSIALNRSHLPSAGGRPPFGQAGPAPSLAARILAHPSNMMSYLRPLPVYTNGRFSGIRLYPGPNPLLFMRVGLRPGDVLTAVNGVTLTSPLQGYNLIQRFAQRHVPIILSIERNGTDLVVSLPSSSAL